MQIVKSAYSNKITPSVSTTIYEYLMDNNDVSGAVAEIHGRYPEKGFAKNELSNELAYVLDGNGKVITPQGEKKLDKGDVAIIPNGELFAWEGNFRIFMATSPKFDPNQHKIIV